MLSVPHPTFAAIVLAAGASSRMTQFKPLLPLGGRTVIEHVLATLRRVDPEEILVVVGHRADTLASVVTAAGATIVHNPDFDRGMFSSVQAGVQRIDPAMDAFFLLPADIPLVRPATLRQLATAWGQEPGRILHPTFDGRRGHPPLIPVDVIPAIIESRGEGGLQAVLARLEDRAAGVPTADAHILFDVDRPEDYAELLERFEQWNIPTETECDAILRDLVSVDASAARHGRRVQQAASAICRAMNDRGADLSEPLVSAGALLHDIAKGKPDHAVAGGRMLAGMGFDRVGAVVAAHRDLPDAELRHPSEAAVVYLAEKLVSGDRFVSIASRFDSALSRFGDDPAARAAVERRRAATLTVKSKIEDRVGRTIEAVISGAGFRSDSREP